ncbi:hypothetical protein PR003_g3810 [Phytophthora rubi]|uniref:Reverse transcriptase Ty1/copia-type domain-containing protein n=1 Tax=Phytophthora rubi TaxID=129364 RepID=A0A6A3JWY3_9STRA|nr:hypothetical protein PR001_g19496 [Phytophthora rubi]KAE9353531.1 hypothetical protein PR003_g3810 [Phytophthora rubi]
MDGGIYFRWVNGSPFFLTLYVDDIVVAATKENIDLVLTELEKKYKILDLRDVSHLLSMEIKYVPANAVRTLGKFLNCYTKEHFVLSKRVLRYLQGTREFRLVWHKPESPGLQLIDADADLGTEKDDRRSITGFVLQLNGCAFAYRSKKQSIITDDTYRAEFVAADNQAAIHVISQVGSGFNVKSVDLKFHKIRDFVERDEFKVEYCPSEDNIADIFTKPLRPQQFCKLRE